MRASAKRPDCKPFGRDRSVPPQCAFLSQPSRSRWQRRTPSRSGTCHCARVRLPSACSFCEMRIVSISAFKAPTPEKIWVAAQNLCVGKKSKFKQTHKQNLYRSFDLVDVIVERRLRLVYTLSLSDSVH